MLSCQPYVPSYAEFIPRAGLAMTTRNALERRGRIRWMVREESRGESDSGWRIFSHIDTSEYLEDTNNWVMVDFNILCNLEPAIIGIWSLPVGSDLQVVDDGQRIRIVDTPTGREIPLEEQFDPTAPPPPGGWPQYRGYLDPDSSFVSTCKRMLSDIVGELGREWRTVILAVFLEDLDDFHIRMVVDGSECTDKYDPVCREFLLGGARKWYASTYCGAFSGALAVAAMATREYGDEAVDMKFRTYRDSPSSIDATYWDDVFFGGDADVLRITVEGDLRR